MNMTITIHKATPKDAPMLAKLGVDTFVAAFGYLYGPRDLRSYLEASHSEEATLKDLHDPDLDCFWAEWKGEPVGYCRVRSSDIPYSPKKAGALDFQKLYILPKAHGVGVGKELLLKGLEAAKARKAPEMYLTVWHNNPVAQHLYGAYGFERVGEYWFPVGKHRDYEYIFRKSLAA